MRKTLFGQLRPGPGGRSIEEPGLLPEWLQVALFGAAAVLALGLIGFLLFRLVQAILWMLG